MPENHGKVTIPARSWVDRLAASEDAQEDALAVLNDETLLAARQYHVDRLEAVYAGETLAEPFRLWGLYGEPRIGDSGILGEFWEFWNSGNSGEFWGREFCGRNPCFPKGLVVTKYCFTRSRGSLLEKEGGTGEARQNAEIRRSGDIELNRFDLRRSAG